MHKIIFAIDPGPKQSAWVNYQDGRPKAFGITENMALREWMNDPDTRKTLGSPDAVTVIEMIASYGMAVGAEVFETCVWIGRFIEASPTNHALMYRGDVKLHLCRSTRAKDSNVRQALIDRFGPGREAAMGTKKNPGPLYGISKDVWSALAVAVTYNDQQRSMAWKK